jgi:hypothetical protein
MITPARKVYGGCRLTGVQLGITNVFLLPKIKALKVRGFRASIFASIP